jgi:hypothetical protein
MESQDFTEVQECLFKKCHRERYDIFTDKEYVRWLQLYHPYFLSGSDTFISLSDQLLVTPQVPINVTCTSTPVSISNSQEATTSKEVTPSTGGTESIISKFLVSPTEGTPTGMKRKSLPRARLLTSLSSLAAIEEKEKQKQEKLKEQQRKRNEREEKKKTERRGGKKKSC